jgi:hypothetical protein
MANPYWRETRTQWARKAVDFFTELGIINDAVRPAWKRASLL